MSRATSKQVLKVLKAQELELSDLFSNLATSITSIVSSYGENISRQESYDIRQKALQKITDTFLYNQNGMLVPYIVFMGKVTPMTPYMNILWGNVIRATSVAVDEHTTIMQKYLANHPMAQSNLLTSTQNPFSPKPLREFFKGDREHNHDCVCERCTVIKETGPSYDPSRSWAGDGVSLSSRIWDVTNGMRRKIDAYLDNAISSQKPTEDIARELEQFLNPMKKLPKANLPYGNDASFNAMRLARTEVAAAASNAALQSANYNPFIVGYKTFRNSAYPCAACDDNADNGPYELSNTSNLTPLHPLCVCGIEWVYAEGDVLKNVYTEYSNPVSDIAKLISPYIPQKFKDLLLSFTN